MKPFEWNTDKNVWLKGNRDFDFDDAVKALKGGGLIAVVPHSNQRKYPKQQVYILNINNYCCLVPFIETEEKIFLKTIYFSRKFTKKYLPKGNII